MLIREASAGSALFLKIGLIAVGELYSDILCFESEWTSVNFPPLFEHYEREFNISYSSVLLRMILHSRRFPLGHAADRSSTGSQLGRDREAEQESTTREVARIMISW